MSLYSLTDSNFQLLLSKSGSKILCTGIQGISLILFYTPDCQYCPDVKDKFRALSQNIKGVHFAICNLRQCLKVLQLSKESTTPFQNVPDILCYINGKPYCKYEGEHTIRGFKEFLALVQSKVDQFMRAPKLQQDASAGGNDIPDGGESITKQTYSTQTAAKRCYLTMDEAYSSGNGNGGNNRKQMGGFKTFEELYGVSLKDDGKEH